MELKEFVSETLWQIVSGVEEAQQKISTLGGEINPSLIGSVEHIAKAGGGIETMGGNYAQIVEFDVAVTAIEGKGTKGGIGIVAGVISLGSTGQSNTENSSVSKLRFKIPLTLPKNKA